ncbi:MAG TPA: TIGR03067 domain-containing protein [Pirellulales bacterium]|nr:TIGR03067 domain-containing protein [Pirellulales bacterium]
MQRLQIITSLVVLAAAALLINRAAADELENDFLKLQGTWTLYYAEWEGSSFLPGASVRLEMNNDRYLLAPNTPSATLGGFALFQMTWPRQINYVPLTGPNAGQMCLGIYSVTGNIQMVCFAPPGQPRPTDFTTFPGSGRMLNVWLKQQ